MITEIGISIVADELNNETVIRQVITQLTTILPAEAKLTASENYTKFPDARKLEYRIAYTGELSKEQQVYQLLMLADSIARPWTVYFDREGDNTELIFNRNENTAITHPVFSHIRWAHIQLIY